MNNKVASRCFNSFKFFDLYYKHKSYIDIEKKEEKWCQFLSMMIIINAFKNWLIITLKEMIIEKRNFKSKILNSMNSW